jgi:hypothetical protein
VHPRTVVERCRWLAQGRSRGVGHGRQEMPPATLHALRLTPALVSPACSPSTRVIRRSDRWPDVRPVGPHPTVSSAASRRRCGRNRS